MNLMKLIRQLKQKIIEKKIDKVFILTNLSNPFYSFSDLDLLNKLILGLKRCVLDVKFVILERLFKDTDLHKFRKIKSDVTVCQYELVGNNNLEYFEFDIQKTKKLIYEGVYFCKDFNYQNSCLLVLSKAHIHFHHKKVYTWTPLEELVFFSNLMYVDYSNYRKIDIWRVIRDDIDIIFNHLKFILPVNVYGVMDARSYKITYEHIPFFFVRKNKEIFYDKNIVNLRSRLIS